MECCILTKNLQMGLQVFEEFKAEQHPTEKPDLVTYNILLKGYSYTKDLGAALRLVEEMKRNKL